MWLHLQQSSFAPLCYFMDKRFFDDVKVYMQAGNGGDGCCSFRRVKYIPKGGPDGGNGGNGGSIILVAKNNLNTLLYFHYNVHHRACNGKNGAGQNMTGANGENKIISVPVGTQVFDETGDFMFADLTKEDMRYTIVHGGAGGIGNMAFKTSVNQTPRIATKGSEGEAGWFRLKLKMLSDVGLIGLPNAGKSSLICALSNAKAEIADYPFTTIKPSLGVVKYGRGRFVMCDIPGLIRDAHKGAGLGDRFLKHIERCCVLAHIIDISSDNIVDDYNVIQNELKQYNQNILNKQILVVFNKIDLLSDDELNEKISLFMRKTGVKTIMCISTFTHVGLRNVVKELFNIVKNK